MKYLKVYKEQDAIASTARSIAKKD